MIEQVYNHAAQRGDKPIHTLAIESSCDETAVAILKSEAGKVHILADIIHSQIEDHKPYGGVVPEIAARAHADIVDRLVMNALDAAKIDPESLDVIGATSGPGLIGGLLVGLMTGKALAMALNIPFLPINHLEAHALSPRITQDCPFPYLLLLVSGGHCQFIFVRGLGDYQRLGSTIDDAAGEAFDKVAKQMGLPFPGGPHIERLAQDGSSEAVALPRPLIKDRNLNMSFAGLKTATARAIGAHPLTQTRQCDIAASFQQAVCDVFSAKTDLAMQNYPDAEAPRRLVVAGGVAANQQIRKALETVAKRHQAELICPPLRYCTDNAVMVALAATEHYRAGRPSDLSARAKSRWPLDETSASLKPTYGHGKRGAKA